MSEIVDYLLLSPKVTKGMNLHLLVLFVHLVSSQPFVKVYIGYDSNTSEGAVEAARHLFDEEIYYTVSDVVDLSDFDNVTLAMLDMDVLFLTSGTQEFATNGNTEIAINSFVSSGGILIYSADSGDRRSAQVSAWLGDPYIFVTSVKSDKTVAEYYINGRSYEYINYLNQYYYQYRAAATSASVRTSFGRSGRFHGDYNIHSFAPDLYWINGKNRGMLINVLNRNYCMFRRTGSYGDSEYFETCFLFSFRHGNGYVVELSADFSSIDIFDAGFTNTTIRAIEGAIRLNKPFVPHEKSVILSAYYYNDNNYNSFVNLAYDLSQKFNVYLWHSFDLDELKDLIRLTNSDTIIVNQIKMDSNPFRGTGSPVFSNGDYYYEFILNGKNMVIICLTFSSI